LLALPVVTLADGAIGFLTTTSTLRAGQQFSWMELGGGDWNGVDVQTVAGVTHAAPSATLPRDITVVTSRDSSSLIFVFTIDDSTRVKQDMTPLSIGDKIIIQLDPNNSRSLGLSVGPQNNITTDYRFEIVLNSGAIDPSQTGFRLPEVIGGGLPNNWGVRTNLSFATRTLLGGPLRYQVTATIPLNLIGNPTTDIGITFAVLNDLGNTATDGSSDVTGSEFPLSMGLDTLVNDLGLVDSEQASGSWLSPARWGTGFFSFTTQDVNFNLSPSFYWSSSIKISKCDASNWDDVPASGVGTDQLTLGNNWYRYNSSAPCKMRIWFNSFKGLAGATKRRFVIFWGRPGTSPMGWIFVTLTDPVVLTNTDTKSFFTWTTVPPVTFSGGHPCIRIYILPETLIAPFDNQAAFSSISTDAQLGGMETTYGLQPNVDAHSAQMNFTATESAASCPTTSPCACLDPLKQLDTASADSVQFIRASYGSSDVGSQPIAPSVPEPQVSRDRQTIRITAEAFGVPVKGPTKKPYTYLERLGGIGWSIDNANLLKQQTMSLPLDISNPLFLQRDFTGASPVDVKSPRRDIFLVINVQTSPGTKAPTIVTRPPNPTLDPGESVPGVITIAPGGGTTVPPGFKRWGLSLHAGVSIPHGNFSNLFNPGPNVAVDLEYRINPTFSLEGIYGFHRFRGATFGTVSVGDINVHQFSFNGKVYGSTAPVRPFFNFGGGAYNFGSGGGTHGGLNVGGGVQFEVTPTFAVEGVYNFHNVFTSGSNTRFSGLQGGVRFRF
jgi:hypothetical protein